MLVLRSVVPGIEYLACGVEFWGVVELSVEEDEKELMVDD